MSRLSCRWLRKSFRLPGRSYASKQRRWIGPAERFLKFRSPWSAWLRSATRYAGTFRGGRLWLTTEMKDEACTLWASGWLAFQHRAIKAFPGLDFNFPVPDPDEEEVKESVSRTRQILGCLLIPSALLLFLVKPKFLPRLALSACLLGLRLLTCMARRHVLLRLLATLP